MLALALLLAPALARAEPVAVRYPEGLVHGFLKLETPAGKILGDAELFQTTQGDEVTSRLVYHFLDGSLQDETTVFRQQHYFRFVRSRKIQKGPSFPEPLELDIEEGGRVTVRTTEHGKAKVDVSTMELPDDLANGMIPVLLKNAPQAAAQLRFSMLAATPKPRLLKLEIAPDGKETLDVGGERREVTRYVIHAKVPGFLGVLAHLAGKTPPDSYVWILHGEAPAFLRADSPFFADGPVWRTQLSQPSWTDAPK